VPFLSGSRCVESTPWDRDVPSNAREYDPMSGFAPGERRWIERLGNLRNVIRQDVIARQLAGFVRPGMTVLDVGCGQGTQAMELASKGCSVTGVDPSQDLLGRCQALALEAGIAVELVPGQIEELDEIISGRTFDVVCCHGVLMYLEDRGAALKALADRLTPEGCLSVTFRNAHALAMRPGLRGNWVGALSAFKTDEYVNELGLVARADRIEHVEQDLMAAGLELITWYGVRVFNDAIAVDVQEPGDEELRLLLEAEDRAGRTDPYRWMASQLHVFARPSNGR